MCEARVSETRSRFQTWSGPLRKSTGFVGLAPTVGQLRAATSAATGESLETEADLVVSLRVAVWGVDVRPDRPDGRGWAIRADRRRYVDRMAGRAGSVSEWYVQGDGLDVNASGATPYAIVAALALS